MNSGLLVDMVRRIRDRELNVDSITIVRNGYVVMDSYFYPFSENIKHNLHSCSNSVVSTLIGIAIEIKYIKDVGVLELNNSTLLSIDITWYINSPFFNPSYSDNHIL